MRIALFLTSLWACFSWANESAQVLPRGVYQFQMLTGTVSGVEERFNSNGLIEGVTAKYHVNLNSGTLERINNRAKELITALNTQFPTLNHLGDQVNLGTLDFHADPHVDYYAPILAYGVRKNITVAVGAPILRIRNQVTVVNGGTNNIAAIRSALSRTDAAGNQLPLDPTMDSYLKELEALNPRNKFFELLSTNKYAPYKPDYDETAVGDTTLTMIYQYHTDKQWDLALRPFMLLPTGRKDDPDDVFDVPTGGESAVGLVSVHDFRFLRKFTLGSAVGYKAHLPDRKEVRVPRDQYDLLPGPERKEDVHRMLGNDFTLEGNIRAKVLPYLQLSGIYEYLTKAEDSYSGDRPGYNYSLLSRDTHVETHTAKAGITFSTLDWFLAKEFAVPFELSYTYADTFQAVNYPNLKIHQLALKAYF